MKKNVLSVLILFFSTMYGAADDGLRSAYQKSKSLTDAELALALKHLPPRAKELAQGIELGHVRRGEFYFSGETGTGKKYAIQAIGQAYYGDRYHSLCVFRLLGDYSDSRIECLNRYLCPIIEAAKEEPQFVGFNHLGLYISKQKGRRTSEQKEAIRHFSKLTSEMQDTGNIVTIATGEIDANDLKDEWALRFSIGNSCSFNNISTEYRLDILKHILSSSSRPNSLTEEQLMRIASLANCSVRRMFSLSRTALGGGNHQVITYDDVLSVVKQNEHYEDGKKWKEKQDWVKKHALPISAILVLGGYTSYEAWAVLQK